MDLSRQLKLWTGDYLCDGCDKFHRHIAFLKSGKDSMTLCKVCVTAILSIFPPED